MVTLFHKRAFVFCLGFAFTYWFSIIEANAASEPVIRVLLLEQKHIRFRADGQKPLLVKGAGFRNKKVRSLEIYESNKNLRFKINGEFIKGPSLSDRTQLIVSSKDQRGIWLGLRRYRGDLRVGMSKRGGLQVVNHLGLEAYLTSVVGSEMPKSWPIEALKAQAVAARTYALRKYRKIGRYDINSTEASQVYLGIESETPSTYKAVRSTRLLVLTYLGQLINAVFHSASGGLTEASGDVWKKQLPYLISVKDFDQLSPLFQWEKTFDQQELRVAFSEIGGLHRIVLLSVSPTGRVLQARIDGPRGELVLSGKELRARLGLRSTLFRFKLISPDFVRNEIQNSFLSFAGLKLDSKPLTKEMRNSFGFWRDWNSGGESTFDPRLPVAIPPSSPSFLFKSTSINQLPIQPLPPLPSRSKNLVLLVRGFGSGHGVGMSQWGANALAKRGSKFRQILIHYYKDIQIKPYSRF